MNKYFSMLVFALGFSQINWTYETVDSIEGLEAGIGFVSLKLDSLIQPHMVYYKVVWDTLYNDTGWAKIVYLNKTGSQWIDEIVDSSFGSIFTNYYISPSLCLDREDNPHIAFVHHNEDNNFSLYYARKTAGQWHKTLLSTGADAPTLALNTNDYPIIACVHKAEIDTVWRLKIFTWNGSLWDSTTVDTNHLRDFNPSLKIDSNNNPHIAYHQGNPDSVKYVFWDGVNWNFYWGESGDVTSSQSLALDINDYPHIAYCRFCLYYTFWDGNVWHTEGPIDPATKVLLELDSLYLPHIVSVAEGLFRPRYCYRDSTTWHLCGYIEPDPYSITFHTVSFSLDRNNNPHVVYFSDNGLSGKLKYARGTFVGINEDKRYRRQEMGWGLKVYPNISSGIINIEYHQKIAGEAELAFYDVSGSIKKSIKLKNRVPGNYREIMDVRNFPLGVYFLVLKQNNKQVSNKFLLIK